MVVPTHQTKNNLIGSVTHIHLALNIINNKTILLNVSMINQNYFKNKIEEKGNITLRKLCVIYKVMCQPFVYMSFPKDDACAYFKL